MAGNINPLTFIGNSSIIENSNLNRVNAGDNSSSEVKEEFLRLLLEKIYLKDFKLTVEFEDEEEEQEFASLSNELSDMVVNDIFRRYLAEQMIDNKAFDLGVE